MPLRSSACACFALIALFAQSASGKHVSGSVQGADFFFISKFCFDVASGGNKPVLKVRVNSNEAKGRQLGGQALYLFDDENDSWAQTASASSCEDLVKYAKNITSLNGTATAMIIPLFGQPPRIEDIYIDLNLKPRWWYRPQALCALN